MPDSGPPLSRMMVETLIKGLEEAKNSVQNLQAQEHTLALQIVEMKGQLTNISEDVSDIKKLVQGSIVEKVRTLESDQKVINQFVEDYKDRKKENVQGKWQLRGVWIASTLGLIGGIGAAVISLFGN